MCGPCISRSGRPRPEGLCCLLPCSLPVCVSFQNGRPPRESPSTGGSAVPALPAHSPAAPHGDLGQCASLPRATARPQARLSAFIFHRARHTLVEKLIWDARALPVNTGSSAHPQPTPAVSLDLLCTVGCSCLCFRPALAHDGPQMLSCASPCTLTSSPQGAVLGAVEVSAPPCPAHRWFLESFLVYLCCWDWRRSPGQAPRSGEAESGPR